MHACCIYLFYLWQSRLGYIPTRCECFSHSYSSFEPLLNVTVDLPFVACQEEEDKAGDQNPWEPARGNQHYSIGWHGEGSCGMSALYLWYMWIVFVMSVLLWPPYLIHLKFMLVRLQDFSQCYRQADFCPSHQLSIPVIFFLQSRTPALVFECINNTDFKVLMFGQDHSCETTKEIPFMLSHLCPFLF